jgi:hypothetical protein
MEVAARDEETGAKEFVARWEYLSGLGAEVALEGNGVARMLSL